MLRDTSGKKGFELKGPSKAGGEPQSNDAVPEPPSSPRMAHRTSGKEGFEVLTPPLPRAPASEKNN